MGHRGKQIRKANRKLFFSIFGYPTQYFSTSKNGSVRQLTFAEAKSSSSNVYFIGRRFPGKFETTLRKLVALGDISEETAERLQNGKWEGLY